MTRRPPKKGEEAVSSPGREPTVDECSCGMYTISDGKDITNPPRLSSDGFLHFFDDKTCRPATKEEWNKSSIHPNTFEESPTTFE